MGARRGTDRGASGEHPRGRSGGDVPVVRGGDLHHAGGRRALRRLGRWASRRRRRSPGRGPSGRASRPSRAGRSCCPWPSRLPSPRRAPATGPRTRCRSDPSRTGTWTRGGRSPPPARRRRPAWPARRPGPPACRPPRPGGRGRGFPGGRVRDRCRSRTGPGRDRWRNPARAGTRRGRASPSGPRSRGC